MKNYTIQNKFLFLCVKYLKGVYTVNNTYPMDGDNGDLSDIWTFYFHDPYDKDWTYSSYIRICDISNISVFRSLSLRVSNNIERGMFFLFRENVFPCWDDPGNVDGGSISFKVLKSGVLDFWNIVAHKVLQDEMLSNGLSFDFDIVTGISVSPKKGYCIIKIWFKNLEIHDVDVLNLDSTLKIGGMFKANKEKILDSH